MISPPNSPRVWITDDSLYFEFTNASGISHSIKLPATVEGFSHAIEMLHARTASTKIGMKGEPTQYMTEKDLSKLSTTFLANGGKLTKKGPAFSQKLQDSARDVLRNMGLI